MAAGGKKKVGMASKQEWRFPQALQESRYQKGGGPEVHMQRVRPHVFGGAEVRPNVACQDRIMTQPGMHCRGMSARRIGATSAISAPPPPCALPSPSPLKVSRRAI